MPSCLKRSSSESDLASDSRGGSTHCSTKVPGVLCRIEAIRRVLSCANLCLADGIEVTADTFWLDNPDVDLRAVDSFASAIRGKPTMVLLRGPSGSGKTTFASAVLRRLALTESPVLLSTDDFYERVDGSYKFVGCLISTAHRWNRWRARYHAAKLKSPILIDNTNLAPFEMAPYFKIADEFGYDVVIKEPPTPWRRDPGKCAAMSKHKVSEKKTRQMVDRFQPMDVDRLRHLIATNQASPPTWRSIPSEESAGYAGGGPRPDEAERREVQPIVPQQRVEQVVAETRTLYSKPEPGQRNAQLPLSFAPPLTQYSPVFGGYYSPYRQLTPQPDLPVNRAAPPGLLSTAFGCTLRPEFPDARWAANDKPSEFDLSSRVEEAISSLSRVTTNPVQNFSSWEDSVGVDWEDCSVQVVQVAAENATGAMTPTLGGHGQRRAPRNRTRHPE